MNTPRNTSSHTPRQGHPYRVPEGYFAELRNTLRERVAEDSAAERVSAVGGSRWGRLGRMAGLAGAFGCLVLFATVGFYFTGYRAQQRELLAQEGQTSETLLGYRLYSEDIEELQDYLSDEDDGTQQTLLAEAVTDYLDIYGYGGVDLADLLENDNE
ncbi:hypothetical protein [uncultured Rikenella sp.]|uniref:hypothetical protein n=1 Tax=uncultured Rikenella sp. TaxID=368003 RepID=UPI0026269998|nr:hypothetical protein [uncultured Rikenella sp.]